MKTVSVICIGIASLSLLPALSFGLARNVLCPPTITCTGERFRRCTGTNVTGDHFKGTGAGYAGTYGYRYANSGNTQSEDGAACYYSHMNIAVFPTNKNWHYGPNVGSQYNWKGDGTGNGKMCFGSIAQCPLLATRPV